MTEERRPSANFIGFIFHLFNICTVTAPRSYTQELNKRLSAWLSKHSNLFTSSSSLYSVLTFKSFALTIHHFFPEISSTLDLQWILGHEGYTRPVLQIQGTGARICRLHLEEFGQPSSLSCDVISLEFGRSRVLPLSHVDDVFGKQSSWQEASLWGTFIWDCVIWCWDFLAWCR